MSTRTRFLLGTLLAAVAGSCAGVNSTAVPVRPVADGRPVGVTTYDLTVDGQPGGRVLLADGIALREAVDRKCVHLGMRVENTSVSQAFTLPIDQLFLTSLSTQPVTVTEVDSHSAPPSLYVPPGQSRSFDLAFALPDPMRIDDVRGFQLHWELLVDGAREPVLRTTAFLTNERGRIYGYPQRGYDLPAMPNQRYSAHRGDLFDLERASAQGGRAHAEGPGR
jgi:hypothetical protein